MLSESLSESDEMKGLRDDRYKLLVHLDAETVARTGRSHLPAGVAASLFDLVRDPASAPTCWRRAADEHAERRAGSMTSRAAPAPRAVVGHAEEGELSPEALEGLRALGYVE